MKKICTILRTEKKIMCGENRLSPPVLKIIYFFCKSCCEYGVNGIGKGTAMGKANGYDCVMIPGKIIF